MFMFPFWIFFSVKTCSPIPEGVNTEPVPVGLELNYTQSYEYKCMEGYTTSEPLCTVCLEDSTLSNEAPNCTSEYDYI